jgi:hypothetical protein
MTNKGVNGREMLTADQVHELTGVPISTLHDWAAKRERHITSASVTGIAVGPEVMSRTGSNRLESDAACSQTRVCGRASKQPPLHAVMSPARRTFE